MLPYAEVIGDPIAHSKSPLIHGFWLKALGLDHEYRALRVAREELAVYFAERRQDPHWLGCNLTAPLKEEALSFLDSITVAGSQIGAVNIVRSRNGYLIGANSDVDGIAEALPRETVAGKRILVIGAGGAARAALHQFLACGAGEVRLLARRPGQVTKLAAIRNARSQIELSSIEDLSFFQRAEIVVNATPLGMRHAPMPQRLTDAVRHMSPEGIAFDMVYEPLETPLLRAARSAGLTTIDGLTMLVGQAAKGFGLFFGAQAPRQHDPTLRELLAAR